MIISSKICIACHKEKKIDFFHKDSFSEDGFRSKCAECIASLRIRKREKRNNKDLLGVTFGKLTVIGKKFKISKRGVRTSFSWKCACKCGRFCFYKPFNLETGQLKSCGCSHTLRGKDNSRHKGYEEIPAAFFSVAKNGAKRRKIVFKISMEDLWRQYLNQNKKCALSGIDLKFPKSSHGPRENISLDRIDSKKGYTKDNIQFIHKKINVMKMDSKEEDFIKMCKTIAEYNK